MVIASKLRWVALAGIAGLLGCQRCSSASGGAPSIPADAASSADTPPASVDASHDGATGAADVPEILDTGRGSATAALRAVLKAYGIAFDAATIERECKVDDDGASLDDIEDVAVKYGIEAGTVIVPAEHVLLSRPAMLPAIVVVDEPDDEQQFVVAWRLDGDRVEIMDPREGRRWIPRAELQKRLHLYTISMPLDEYRAAIGAADFGEALQARMAALGVDRADGGAPRALFEQASADPGWRGLGALDAAIRAMEASPPDAGADTRLPALFACASEDRCEGVSPIPPVHDGGSPGKPGSAPIPPALWSVQAAPKSPGQHPGLRSAEPSSAPGPAGEVRVKGAVLLAIEGPSKTAP